VSGGEPRIELLDADVVNTASLQGVLKLHDPATIWNG
jgi:hypothetical protein